MQRMGDLFEVDSLGQGISFCSQYHLPQFKTSDSKPLPDSKVQNLVNAMAALFKPVIAANWL